MTAARVHQGPVGPPSPAAPPRVLCSAWVCTSYSGCRHLCEGCCQEQVEAGQVTSVPSLLLSEGRARMETARLGPATLQCALSPGRV